MFGNARPPPQFTGRPHTPHDNYDFTFSHSRQPPTRPAGLYDSYRPNYNGGRRGGRRAGEGRGEVQRPPFSPRRERRKNPTPIPAHERLILYVDSKEKTPEWMEGMVTNSGFKNLTEDQDKDGNSLAAGEGDDLEEDVEMAILDGDEEKGGDQEKQHQATNGKGALQVIEGQDFVEEEKKRTDVIEIIRSGKNKLAQTNRPRSALAENDDSIPFSFHFPNEVPSPSHSEEEELDEDSSDRRQNGGRKLRKSNDGRRSQVAEQEEIKEEKKPFSHRDHLYAQLPPKNVDNEPPGASISARSAHPPPPGRGELSKFNNLVSKDSDKKLPSEVKKEEQDDNYTWVPSDDEERKTPTLKKSRRSVADVPSQKRKISYGHRKKSVHKKIDGSIVDDYVAVDGIDPLPWMKNRGDHSRCLDVCDWLHKEIIDFVYYLQPRTYEHSVRHSVINRLRSLIVNLWPDTDLRVFGSYAAGLYLTTSDIDLVVISRSYAEHGMPKYYGREHLMKLARILRESNFSKLGSVLVIYKAKVPIVKFVDAVTGLKVDVCFENQSGSIANQTFGKWKTKFPAMPLLVLVIKQFLAMRGLNEVHLGGLGSFSVTCLVVSLLQLLPSVASGKIDPSLHLGLILLQFLELYGKKFNIRSVGIRVDDRPGYFPKKHVFPQMGDNPSGHQMDLLCIQDPNNHENNISKSSFLIPLILSCFSDAYNALVLQMGKLDRMALKQRKGRSVLGVMMGGNYDSIKRQRRLMKQIYRETISNDTSFIDSSASDSDSNSEGEDKHVNWNPLQSTRNYHTVPAPPTLQSPRAPPPRPPASLPPRPAKANADKSNRFGAGEKATQEELPKQPNDPTGLSKEKPSRPEAGNKQSKAKLEREAALKSENAPLSTTATVGSVAGGLQVKGATKRKGGVAPVKGQVIVIDD
ncbi:hypothetical protein RUND412_009781 [Rhizina undulata]